MHSVLVEINCMSTRTGGLFPPLLYTTPIYSVTDRVYSSIWYMQVFFSDLRLSDLNSSVCTAYCDHALLPDATMVTYYHLKTIEKTPHLQNTTDCWKGLQTVQLLDCNGLYQALMDNARYYCLRVINPMLCSVSVHVCVCMHLAKISLCAHGVVSIKRSVCTHCSQHNS